jgi:hypothetical protein
MYRATRVALLAASFLFALACSSIRTTGPKTAFDYCVDDCDNAYPHCSFASDTGCRIEYDACVASCDRRDEAKLH